MNANANIKLRKTDTKTTRSARKAHRQGSAAATGSRRGRATQKLTDSPLAANGAALGVQAPEEVVIPVANLAKARVLPVEAVGEELLGIPPDAVKPLRAGAGDVQVQRTTKTPATTALDAKPELTLL